MNKAKILALFWLVVMSLAVSFPPRGCAGGPVFPDGYIFIQDTGFIGPEHAGIIATGTIKALGESGRICAVFGHHWQNSAPVVPGASWRECLICGKTQTMDTKWRDCE